MLDSSLQMEIKFLKFTKCWAAAVADLIDHSTQTQYDQRLKGS